MYDFSKSDYCGAKSFIIWVNSTGNFVIDYLNKNSSKKIF
jgi:hypothetical protein